MATNEEIVAKAQQLYVSYYGRPADPEGLAFWVAAFTASDNVDQVLVDFGTSAEYTAWSTGLTTSELITALYQQMFNRDPDAEGLAFYTDLIDTGAASLASIALDIANGATGDDVTILANKVEVANDFTADVEASSAAYSESVIPGAQAVLAFVDATAASVTAGLAASATFVAALPVVGAGGEFTLDEDSQVGDFSAYTGAVTVILDGRNDEANFNLTLSTFDDTVILEEFQTAAITDVGGVDTLDTSAYDGATVNLLAGTFKMLDNATNYSGTISGVENVIGTRYVDTITGDSGNNTIFGGAGADILKGGLGDDVFSYEDESEMGTGTTGGSIDGQTGDDTLVLTADTLNLTSVIDSKLAVENLVLSNTLDASDTVTLALAENGLTTATGLDDFESITGSAALDTIVIAGNVDTSATTLSSIEVLASSVANSTFAIGAATTGVALADGQLTPTKNMNLALVSSKSASFDTAGLVLSGFDSINAGSVAGVYQTITLNQNLVDQLLTNGAAAQGAIFAGLGDIVTAGATKGSDVATLTGNVDFTGFTNSSDIDLSTVVMGTGVNTVLFGDYAGGTVTTYNGINALIGSAGDDTVVITPTESQDLTAKSISGVENVIFDVATAAFGTFAVTVAETSLAGVKTINGEVNVLANVSGTKEATLTVDLTGVEITDGYDLSSVAGADRITISQEGLDGFKTVGSTGYISLNVADGTLDVSATKFTVTTNVALDVKGSSGDDTVVGEGQAQVGPGGRLLTGGSANYTLGAGNDTFSGVANKLNLGGGNNTANGVVALGNITLKDGTTTGSTDGNNLVLGVGLAGVAGGKGNDTLIGFFDAYGTTGSGLQVDLGAGNDSLVGRAGGEAGIAAGAEKTLLGSGDDSFASLSPSLQLLSAAAFGFNGGTVAFAAGNSAVNGGTGDDSLSSQISGDELTGGDGSDVFTVSGKSFSPVFVGTAAGTKSIGGGIATSAATKVAINGNGVVLVDVNVGVKDVLHIDLVGTYTTGTTLTTGKQALSGTTTITTALAAARTANGGVRVLDANGVLRTVAEGSAIGSTVALPDYADNLAITKYLHTAIGTKAGKVVGSLADTTYVVFAFNTVGKANLLAYLVTAAAGKSADVTANEVATIHIASISATDGLGGQDIILI